MLTLDRYPPVSWLVWLFDRMARLVGRVWELLSAPLRPVLAPVDQALARLFAPVARWNARHHAREMDDLAEALERAGMPTQAAQVSVLADRWRERT